MNQCKNIKQFNHFQQWAEQDVGKIIKKTTTKNKNNNNKTHVTMHLHNNPLIPTSLQS